MTCGRALFISHPNGKYDGKLTKAANSWKEPDDLIEALFALSRKAVENEPLKIFMALSDLDRRRATPLSAAMVDRLARGYKTYNAQYTIFNEASTLKEETIGLYLDTAESITKIRDQAGRADAAGTMQALVSLWQIFCRQESIAPAEADATLSAIVGSVPETARVTVSCLMPVMAASKFCSRRHIPNPILRHKTRSLTCWPEPKQQRIVESHTQLVQDMIRIFEAQRLVSLKTIIDLEQHLESLSRGEKLNTALVQRLATRIAEIQLPRSALSGVEKNSFAFGYWTEKHVETQRKLNMRAAIEKAANDPEKLKDLRGLLAPILRDTLVGLNYVHYAPPGAQILITNPLFVRGHDFLGIAGHRSNMEANRGVRIGLAFERRRQTGWLPRRAALRACRSRTELSDSDSRAGAHLGRPGAADDSDGQGSALVACDSGADLLGRPAHALYANPHWRKRRWIRQSASELLEHAGRVRTTRPRLSDFAS